MTKNTKTYLLLGLVLAIWGIIAYRIFSAVSPEKIEEVQVAELSIKPLQRTERDTFSIKADYRDPFLGTMPQKKVKPKKNKTQTPKKPLSNIVYTGSIENKSTKERVYFLTINGQQHIVGKGQKASGITLISGTNSHITVRDGGRTRKIVLTQ